MSNWFDLFVFGVLACVVIFFGSGLVVASLSMLTPGMGVNQRIVEPLTTSVFYPLAGEDVNHLKIKKIS